MEIKKAHVPQSDDASFLRVHSPTVIKTNAGLRPKCPREHSDQSPETLLATETGVVRVPVAVETAPREHHLVDILDEVRDVAALNASPSEDGLPGEVSPEELDPLGLNDLEFEDIHAAGQQAGVNQVRQNGATLNQTGAPLIPVEPKLRFPRLDGGDDVDLQERHPNLGEAGFPSLTEASYILGRPPGRLKCISELVRLSFRKTRHVSFLSGHMCPLYCWAKRCCFRRSGESLYGQKALSAVANFII